jgi:hypothetical protein
VRHLSVPGPHSVLGIRLQCSTNTATTSPRSTTGQPSRPLQSSVATPTSQHLHQTRPVALNANTTAITERERHPDMN